MGPCLTGLFHDDSPRITARVHAGGSYRGPDPGPPATDHLLKELALRSGTEGDVACTTRVPQSCQRAPLALSNRGAQCGGGETPRSVSKEGSALDPEGLAPRPGLLSPTLHQQAPPGPVAAGCNLMANVW